MTNHFRVFLVKAITKAEAARYVALIKIKSPYFKVIHEDKLKHLVRRFDNEYIARSLRRDSVLVLEYHWQT